MKSTHKAGTTLRLVSNENMVTVKPTEVRLTWAQRLKVLVTGRVISVVPSPHPEVIQIDQTTYFGHPATIETFKREIQEGQRAPAAGRPRLHAINDRRLRGPDAGDIASPGLAGPHA